MLLTAKLFMTIGAAAFIVGAFGMNRAVAPNAAYASLACNIAGVVTGIVGVIIWWSSRHWFTMS